MCGVTATLLFRFLSNFEIIQHPGLLDITFQRTIKPEYDEEPFINGSHIQAPHSGHIQGSDLYNALKSKNPTLIQGVYR